MSDQSPKGIKDYVRMDKLDIPLVITIVAVFIVAMATLIPYLPTVGYWPEDFAELTEIIRNWALMFVGAFALWLAWRRIVLMDQQTTVALQDSKQKEMDHVAARFETAVTLLGSDNEMSRVVGMGAVRDVAFKYPEDYGRQAADLICAFIRMKRPVDVECDGLSAAVKAALKMLSRMMQQEWSTYDYDLTAVRFDGLMVYGWDFDLVDCTGSTFVDAHLYGCRIAGDICNQQSLEGVNFNACEINGWFATTAFGGASFYGCKLNDTVFRSADMTNVSFLRTTIVTRFSRIGDPDGRLFPVFSDCQMDGARIEKWVGGNRPQDWDGNFRSSDFKDCWVCDQTAMPPSTNGNQPQLVPTLLRPYDDGGHYIEFREIDDDEE